MPNHGQPLGADDIRSRLQEVAGELAPHGPQHTLVIVGGSLMAWRGLRESTADVDTVHRVDAELVAAVAAVATIHGLSPTWLNDRAAGFMPATFDIHECETLLSLPRLRVLGAPLAQLFLMKLYAGRDRDIDDLVTLWPVSDSGRRRRQPRCSDVHTRMHLTIPTSPHV